MRSGSSGFTLLELTIVLLLLGIVLAGIVPSMKGTIDEMKLDGAAREIVTAIQYVQSHAIKEGIAYGIQIVPSLERFRCYKKSTGHTIYNPHDKKPYDVYLSSEGYLKGVDIVSRTFPNGTIEFNSLGEPLASGTIVLGYGSMQKTITISFPLGDVSVN